MISFIFNKKDENNKRAHYRGNVFILFVTSLLFCVVMIIMILALICKQANANDNSSSNSFFQERYVGWYWFDEVARPDAIAEQEQQQQQQQVKSTRPTMQEYLIAEAQMKEFSRRLELARFMMIRYPDNLEYIKQYKEMEKIMHKNALKLSMNYTLVNFLNPNIADELNNPSNLYGRRLKEAHDSQQQAKTIKSMASSFELFVFLSKDDPYSSLLDKHLANFNAKYKFTITAVTDDKSKSKYFKTHDDIKGVLRQKLSLDVTPAVIAVSVDGKMRYELARGAVSIADLEEKLLLVAQDLRRRHKQERDYQGRFRINDHNSNVETNISKGIDLWQY